MKRITTLLLVAVMVIGTAGLAGAAVEFKASGHMHLNFSVLDNDNSVRFDKDAAQDNFFAAQRFRPKLTMKAEGVTGVFEVQQHQSIWGKDWPVGGNPNISGAGSIGDSSVRIRQAYVDFKLPSTPVSLKVGYQQLNLPSIWGHPVFQARVGAALATIPFNDQVALNAFWARPAHDTDTASQGSHNSTDMFGAILPLNFNTVKVAPYLVYARVGQASAATDPAAENDTLIVGGANVEIMATDALSVKVDAIVTNYSSDTDTRDIGAGFMFAAAVDYEMPWGTPGAFAWYSTGPDEDGEGAFYTVKTDGFGPSSWGFTGGNTFAYDSQINSANSGTAGTAAIGVQIADMSFVDSLKHTVRLLYAVGTGDDSRIGNGAAWTTKDSFIEANLDSTWTIYENLAAVIELGALLPDLGSKTKDGDPAGTPAILPYGDDLALKAQLTLRFSF